MREFTPKFFTVFREGYSRKQAARDITAGIIVGIVALPLAIAFAKVNAALNESGSDNVSEGTDSLNVPAGVEIYEVNGPLFFGASHKFRETIRVMSKDPRALIIRMRHVPVVDATGLHNLKETINQMRGMKTKVILSGVQPHVYEALRKAGIVAMLGKANVLPDIREALRRAREVLSEEGNR